MGSSLASTLLTSPTSKSNKLLAYSRWSCSPALLSVEGDRIPVTSYIYRMPLDQEFRLAYTGRPVADGRPDLWRRSSSSPPA